MTVRIVGIINLVADTPHYDTRMIAVSANQIDKVALMPDREVYIISLVLGWIDVMSGTPFVFRPFPLVKGLINDETKEYFQKHGGYENATKVTMTKWDPNPVKQSISTSGSGQSGTIVSENASGATVDIGGTIYIVHASKGFAFASEAVNTAVAGKDIVMPDYINYKGKRFPVTEMRGDIFWGKPIKSIKLPSTLTEISNAALRERKP